MRFWARILLSLPVALLLAEESLSYALAESQVTDARLEDFSSCAERMFAEGYFENVGRKFGMTRNRNLGFYEKMFTMEEPSPALNLDHPEKIDFTELLKNAGKEGVWFDVGSGESVALRKHVLQGGRGLGLDLMEADSNIKEAESSMQID